MQKLYQHIAMSFADIRRRIAQASMRPGGVPHVCSRRADDVRAPESGAAELEELKDAYWELAEREARYRHLLDSQADLIVRRTPDGMISFANSAFCHSFAVAAQDIIGRTFWPAVLNYAGQPDVDEAGSRSIEQLATVAGPRWIAWETRRLINADGAQEIQSFGRDVTEERRLLEDLERARDRALEASRAKSRFLAAMSHEIRTPMNGILGMVGLLRETTSNTEQYDYIHAIETSARALLALIDEILDFSKIEAGKLELACQPFSLEACIGDALRLLTPKADAKDLVLGAEVAADVPPWLAGDETRVRQILLNLISNAIKFTDRGSVRVMVNVLAGNDDDGWTVSLGVQDTGIGLSAIECERLFAEFEQGDAALSRHAGGTGLGLAISRRLARAMGGDLTVESLPGQGATFTATMRLACAAQPAQGDDCAVYSSRTAAVSLQDDFRQGSPATADPRSVRILIAEDNAVNALLARRIVERFGAEAVVVSDGQAAVDMLEASIAGHILPFDVVLMDVFMPKVDGLDATRIIRQRLSAKAKSGQCALPIIALTANAYAEDEEACRAAGMTDYLSKPFDADQLKTMLRRHVPDFLPDTHPRPHANVIRLSSLK